MLQQQLQEATALGQPERAAAAGAGGSRSTEKHGIWQKQLQRSLRSSCSVSSSNTAGQLSALQVTDGQGACDCCCETTACRLFL